MSVEVKITDAGEFAGLARHIAEKLDAVSLGVDIDEARADMSSVVSAAAALLEWAAAESSKIN